MLRCSAIIVTYNSGESIGPAWRRWRARTARSSSWTMPRRTTPCSGWRHFVAWHPVHLLRISRKSRLCRRREPGSDASGERRCSARAESRRDRRARSRHCAAAMPRRRTRAAAGGGALLEAAGRAAARLRLSPPADSWQLAMRGFAGEPALAANPVNRRYRCLDADYSQPQEVEQPAGACLAITREAWDAVGGFDEQFFPVWFEDVDLLQAAARSGRKIVYCPAARFRHCGAHSVGKLSFARNSSSGTATCCAMRANIFPRLRYWILRVGIIKGMFLRSLRRCSVLGRRL